MTSTMKSEPGRPARCGISFGMPVSAATWCAVGGSAEGILAAPAGGVAAFVTWVAVVVAAPATATPARNFRRLTSRFGCFRAIENLPLVTRQHGLLGRVTRLYRSIVASGVLGGKADFSILPGEPDDADGRSPLVSCPPDVVGGTERVVS